VVGTDIDATEIDLARAEAASAGLANLEYRVADAMEPPSDGEHYDIVYTRFLLTHLPDPARAVRNICSQLAPGGVLLVEDIDSTGHFCHPHSDAYWRYVELYTKAVQGRGCDPNIGPRLPALLHDAGLRDRGMNVVQQPASRVR
jgi:2-polyprenyl-3-methyl-5-hydroxy-6-metoxy-1,4-benzoquinol methylase